MFTLKEWWKRTFDAEPYSGWDGKVLCVTGNTSTTLKTNITQGFLACYTFTLVTSGSATLMYNGRHLSLANGDLYIYSPGMEVAIIDISHDYQSICLMVDEFTTLESPATHDMVSLAFMPLVRLSTPILKLTNAQVVNIEARLREMIAYQLSDNVYKDKLLRMLYAVFLVDLQNLMENSITERQVSPRIEEIFIEFNRLLPQHFINHRDIAFYADRLCITPDYLSRVVKRVSGRTVGDYINQMLLMEACHLLRASSMSIAQIADRLRFSESAAFSRFFARLKGITPNRYRKQ